MPRQRRPKPKSEYGLQLLEKQKIRREYNLREHQFRGYFRAGDTPQKVYELLESRLDNAVYRAGFALSHPQARQIVSHGHILVNQRRVNIPSFRLRPGDSFSIRQASSKAGVFADLDMRLKKYEPPHWLSLDKKKKDVKISNAPSLEKDVSPFNLQTVLEFYKR